MQPSSVHLCSDHTLSGPRYTQRIKRESEKFFSGLLKLTTPCPPWPHPGLFSTFCWPLRKTTPPSPDISWPSWHSPPWVGSLKENWQHHIVSPLATHSPTPWPSSHPLIPLHPHTVVSLPALFTFVPPAHGHTVAAEGYAPMWLLEFAHADPTARDTCCNQSGKIILTL